MSAGLALVFDRRSILVGAAAFVAAYPAGAVALKPGGGTLRVASVKFGSLSWLLETIKAEGLDAKAGLDIEIVPVASNQAGPVALLAGEADVIVSDWTWAMRQRSLGELVKFFPYSSALGALMVPKDAGFQSLADLSGKRVGVAGSAIDKSWLLLRAYSKRVIGRDIADTVQPVFGAAPLITEELRNGRIDAALNYWTFAARLSSDRFVQLIGMADVLKQLDVDPTPPLVGYVYRETTASAKRGELDAFFRIVAEGNAVLARSDEAWTRLASLIKPANDGELQAIKAFYRSGIPNGWTGAETRSAEKLMSVLIEAGDKELLGPGTEFDASLFDATS